eukprot:TRINITY_DN8204_c0_g14_i1.p2 TRINITY_DN8204_c0_g14~~TRINITY_DN8204_c0_g14_i1.p2  ORF type:complete len:225 (+),score=97.70 TRINITY_DN8204_c0_g14_i1:98-772(+)
MTAVSVEWDIFEMALREAEDALEAFRDGAYGAEHPTLLSETRTKARECTAQLKAVDAALQELMSPDERAAWKKKLTGGRQSLKGLEKDIQALDSDAAKRARLFDGMKQHLGDAEDPDGAFSLRAQAEGTSRMLHSQNRSLGRSEHLATEGEQSGINTLNTLRRNRDQMLTTIEKTEDLQDELRDTRVVVTGIRRVMVYNRVTQVLIIICLSLGLILTVYFRWMR